MGTQYVIFVDETLVAGSVQMAAAYAGLGLERGGAIAPLGLEQQLNLRRGVLDNLAAALTHVPVAAAGTAAAGAAAANSAAEAMGKVAIDVGGAALDEPAASHVDPKTIQILEGISAIVVDEDAIDVASLQGVVGLTVVPNIEVRLPTPVAVETQEPAEDWHLTMLGLAPGTPGGGDVLIGILDTGIDAAHPEFAGKRIHFAEFDAAGRMISNVPRDAGEHGTHVSSIAAGAQSGVAPNADLAVAAVLTIPDSLGRMTGNLVQIVNGFNWLVTARFREATPGVDVINASLGGAGFNTYLQQSVRTAFQLGVPLIAAIGNAGRGGAGRHGSPGNYPEVFGIGATDNTDTIAEFSDWGLAAPPVGPNYPVPDICAPGVQVLAAKPGGGRQRMSGTSMATPVVSGVAARRMSANSALVGHPAALFTDLRSRLAPYNPNRLGNQGGAGRIIA
jgi:subtilisin family serine protease